MNSVNRANDNNEPINISADFKFDGLSGVFEYDNGWKHVIMRGDVELNDGTDISELFSGTIDIPSLFKYPLPKNIYKQPFGLKTEILMMQSDYDKYVTVRAGKPANRRSAVSSILNSDDEFDPDWLKYLTIIPLQISTDEQIKVDGNWRYVGVIDNRHQYIRLGDIESFTVTSSIGNSRDTINHINTTLKSNAESMGLPIDGVVYTITNNTIISKLGRSNNINKFQIAYKFPAGIKKTKLIDVEFPVGSLGTVTPLAIVEPVVINGSTITHSTLSNFAKLNALHLHIGDEVKIRYDIVPILEKDSSCKEAKSKLIAPPKYCPACGELLDTSTDIARCTNRESCPSRIFGKIINYINKLNIIGIGDATVKDLMDMNVVRNISDLYKLKQHEKFLLQQDGYSHKKINNMISSIYSRTNLFPHEILGAIGIPDVGRRVMETVCRNIPLNILLTEDECTLISKLSTIKGIGNKMATKIVDGIEHNKILIHDILTYVTVKEYDNMLPTETVCFTNIRDKDFETFLESKNVKVKDGYSKSVDILIVPNYNSTSTKVTKAKSDNKTILSIEDAYKKYGYSI